MNKTSEAALTQSRSDVEKHRSKITALDLSRQFRRRIAQEATDANTPSIIYKHQWLLEEVIADMESFV